MRRLCIVVAWAILLSAGPTEAALVVLVEPDLQAYLFNPDEAPLAFDGYHLSSSSNALDPGGWKSISDYSLAFESQDVVDSLGLGALTFGETKPSTFSLAELNLGSFGVMQPGDRFAIGRPFAGTFESLAARVGTEPGVVDDPRHIQLTYHQPTTVPALAGDIIAVPEPSISLLAALAGIGLLAFRRRGIR